MTGPLIAAFFLGLVAGLRTLVAPAAIAWAATLGRLGLHGTPLEFFSGRLSAWIFSLLAAAEFVTDLLPITPSRLVATQLAARVLSGGICGAALGMPSGARTVPILLGMAGALAGAYGGAAMRARLAQRLGRDRPAALVEDAVALLLAFAVMTLS